MFFSCFIFVDATTKVSNVDQIPVFVLGDRPLVLFKAALAFALRKDLGVQVMPSYIITFKDFQGINPAILHTISLSPRPCKNLPMSRNTMPDVNGIYNSNHLVVIALA